MDLPFKAKWGIWSVLIFILVIANFTFIDDSLSDRIIVYSVMISTILMDNLLDWARMLLNIFSKSTLTADVLVPMVKLALA